MPFIPWSNSTGDELPQTNYRDSARTSARTSVWNGTGSAPDETTLRAAESERIKAMQQKRPTTAANLLKLAKTFSDRGDEETAKRWYRKVADQYTETDAAQEARLLLGETVSPTTETPTFRTWVDSTGNHKVEATFISFDGELVTLQRRDGPFVTLPLKRLCDADQEEVHRLAGTGG